MTGRKPNHGFVSRPGDIEAWITSPETSSTSPPRGAALIARRMIDVTLEWRGHIEVAAFQRNVAVADMRREMLERAFSEHGAVP